MPFFVLLLKPKVRKFELIQFQRNPERPTIQGVLEQTSLMSSNPEFQHQKHIGLYCPRTGTELLLPGASYPSKRNRSSRSTSSDSDTSSLNSASVTGDVTSISETGQQTPQEIKVETTIHEESAKEEEEEQENEQEEKGDRKVGNDENDPSTSAVIKETTADADEQTDPPVETIESSSTKEKEENKKELTVKTSEDQTSVQETTPDPDPAFATDEPHERIASSIQDEEPQQQASGHDPVLIEQKVDPSEHPTETSEYDGMDDSSRLQSPMSFEASTEDPNNGTENKEKENDTQNEEKPDHSAVLDFEKVGPLFVAIPKRYKLKHVVKLANKILESPAFKILTQGNSLIPNKPLTSTERELQQLQQQNAQNEQTTAAYQQQQQDLEQRRQKAAQQELERRTSPKTAVSPDSHGLSPLDAMRIAQNQQKAKAREQERATLQQYQRHNDTMALSNMEQTNSSSMTLDTETLGISSSPNNDEDASTMKTNPSPASDIEASSSPGMFVSSAASRRQSLEQQKQAELDALRQQGLTAKSQKTYDFGKSPTFSTSAAATKRRSLEEQRNAEGQAQSWKPNATTATTSSAPTSPTKPVSNRSVRSMVVTSMSSSSSQSFNELVSPASSPAKNNIKTTMELEQLRQLQMTKNTQTSLREITTMEKNSNSNLASSMPELEELRGLGLAKSLKSQLTDTVKANEKQSEAYQAQLQDLQERKAKTKTFEPSHKWDLSAADEQLLNLTKQKRNERQKEREAMGYYQSYKGEAATLTDKEKAWKTTGKVLTTTGTSSNIKEWQAPDETTKMETPRSPDVHTVPQDTTTKGSSTTESQAKEQGCACIIL